MQTPELNAAWKLWGSTLPLLIYILPSSKNMCLNVGGKPGKYSNILILFPSVKRLGWSRKESFLGYQGFTCSKISYSGMKWVTGDASYKCNHKTPQRLLKLCHLQILVGSFLLLSAFCCLKQRIKTGFVSELLNIP